MIILQDTIDNCIEQLKELLNFEKKGFIFINNVPTKMDEDEIQIIKAMLDDDNDEIFQCLIDCDIDLIVNEYSLDDCVRLVDLLSDCIYELKDEDEVRQNILDDFKERKKLDDETWNHINENSVYDDEISNFSMITFNEQTYYY